VKSIQPNSRSCFVCGLSNPFGLHLRFYDTGPGEVAADYTVSEQYQGYPGVVHGGIVAAMLDELAGRVHMGGDPPRFLYTARLEVHYRRNVPVGQPLHLVGKAVSTEGRKATSTSAIYDQAGTLLAEANALLINVPDKVIQSTDLESLGWKVYPVEEEQL
jgi:acyl-coenzyme A thioesterase PaaI-like protein